MLSYSSTIDRHLLPVCKPKPAPSAPTSQWTLFISRVQWLMTPHSSDAGAHELELNSNRGLGLAKTLLSIHRIIFPRPKTVIPMAVIGLPFCHGAYNRSFLSGLNGYCLATLALDSIEQERSDASGPY